MSKKIEKDNLENVTGGAWVPNSVSTPINPDDDEDNKPKAVFPNASPIIPNLPVGGSPSDFLSIQEGPDGNKKPRRPVNPKKDPI